MLPRQLQEQIFSLEISGRDDIMTMLLMPSLLIKSDKSPAKQANGQLLIGLQILFQLLDELLVLRWVQGDYGVIIRLISDLLLFSFLLLHTVLHLYQVRVDRGELVEAGLWVQNWHSWFLFLKVLIKRKRKKFWSFLSKNFEIVNVQGNIRGKRPEKSFEILNFWQEI